MQKKKKIKKIVETELRMHEYFYFNNLDFLFLLLSISIKILNGHSDFLKYVFTPF